MNGKLMIGNAAVARGLYEAGCSFVSSYPGTPSTEISEFAAGYPEIYAEWAPNEKCALEAAIGASFAGARAFSAMKHVGLNVAADPLFTVSYTGVNGGLVIAVADDIGMHSSQNEQDSRHYAISAKLPMLEPADSEECLEYTKAAFELSEKLDCPVLIRTTTRIAHSQSIVSVGERADYDVKSYEKNPRKYVMVPANAIVRHPFVEKRMAEAAEIAETSPLNRIEWGNTDIGIIAAGTGYIFAKEAMGDNASYLKLGMVNPLPEKLIRDFASKVKTLYIIEELDDVFECRIRSWGLDVKGKELFSLCGEYSPELIRNRLLGSEMPEKPQVGEIPGRPPVLCPGCPHRGLFHVLSKLKLTVSGDIGCYTLGAAAPLAAMDTTVCMGASIGVMHGMNKVRPEMAAKSVAVIGDSTFMHSGITGLLNVVYNGSNSTVLVLDNSTTGMTGHQQNPATGLTLKQQPAPVLDIPGLCRAIGVKRVRVEDPQDLKGLEKAIKEELAAEEPSVIVVKRPCALLKNVKRLPALKVDAAKCRKCRACMKIGCPALSFGENGASVDASLCVGCGLCAQLCPFDAIGGSENE